MVKSTSGRAVAAIALTVLGIGPALADCRTGWFRWGPSYATQQATMQVPAGSACRRNLKTLDFVAMQEITVVRAPQHGQAGKASRYEFAYKPKDGYVGPDSFEIDVSFDYNGRQGHSRLSFDVDVTP